MRCGGFPSHLEQAQDDATIVAIRDMERAGIDIITDGEIRRESYSNRFATALEGIDVENPGEVKARSGSETPVPRVVGPIRRTRRSNCATWSSCARNTDRAAKITLPGPFTMSQQAKNEFYEDDEEMAMDFAAAVNAEARDLQKAGADVIQLDEPWVRNNPEAGEALSPSRRSTGRWRASRCRPWCICASATPRVVPGSTKPAGYSFLAAARRHHRRTDLDRGGAAQARSRRAEGSARRRSCSACSTSADPEIETPSIVAERIRARPEIRRAGAADPGARLRHEIHAARRRLRQAEGAGRRRRDRAQGR